MANLATYTDVITNIKDQFDDQSSATDTTIRYLIPRKLNDIWRGPSGKARWKFAKKTGTIATVASTESYDLASDYNFGGLYDVVNTTKQTPVYPVGQRDFDRTLPATTSTGSPYLYRLWTVDSSSGIQEIQLYPIPSGVETITYKYYRKPTVVDLETVSTRTTNDALTPDLPQDYRDLLIYACLVDLYLKDESQQANVFQVRYDNLLQAMRNQFADEPDEIHVLGSENTVSGLTTPGVSFPSNYGPVVS